MLGEILRGVLLNKRNRSNPSFKPAGFYDTISREFRVGLRDVDFNMHINNARYLRYMERGRWDFPVQTATWDLVVKHKLNFLVAGAEIGYYKELPLFKRFRLETQYLGWDNKYFYIEQIFKIGDVTYASGIVKAVFVQKRKVVEPAKIAELVGVDAPENELPEYVKQWKAMMESRKANA